MLNLSTDSFLAYFPGIGRSVVKNFLLIVQAFLTAKSINLNVAKDRLGSLLQVSNRQPCSHYKRSGSKLKLVVH